MSELRVDDEHQPGVTRAEMFVLDLIRSGVAPLHSPAYLRGRSFVVASRGMVPLSGQDVSVAGLSGKAITSIYFDLFEVFPYNGEQIFLPIGHRDYRVIYARSGVVADGNMSNWRVPGLRGPIPKNSFFDPYQVADGALGVASNGIDVLTWDSHDPREGYSRAIYQKTRHVLTKLGLQDPVTYRGLRFVNLLMGVGLISLKLLLVDHLHLDNPSDPVMHILEKVGIQKKTGNIPLSQAIFEKASDLVAPFIPDGTL